MQISTATLLASQSLPATAKSSEPSAAFSPLLFKKAGAAPAPAAPAAPSAPVKLPSASAPAANPGNAYRRPGSTIDIKV